MKFPGYTARSFAIPHYGSQGDPARNGAPENQSPCQPSVMDGFFQNKTSQPRNDLPVLEKTARGWEETTGHNCDTFITAQDLAISRAAANGGYWLDSEGNLRKGGFGTWMTAQRSTSADNASFGYTTWPAKGSDYGAESVNGR